MAQRTGQGCPRRRTARRIGVRAGLFIVLSSRNAAEWPVSGVLAKDHPATVQPRQIARGSGSSAISITVAVPAVMALEVTTLEPPGGSVPPVLTSMPPAVAAPVI